MSKKLYESDCYVVWRGLDETTILNMNTEIEKEEKVFCIYAIDKEFAKYLDINTKFPESSYLAIYHIIDEISDDWIIERHKNLDDPNFLEWKSPAGYNIGLPIHL